MIATETREHIHAAMERIRQPLRETRPIEFVLLDDAFERTKRTVESLRAEAVGLRQLLWQNHGHTWQLQVGVRGRLYCEACRVDFATATPAELEAAIMCNEVGPEAQRALWLRKLLTEAV